jgi:hypothetical protein
VSQTTQTTQPPLRRATRRSARRRTLRRVALVVAVLMVPVVWSYADAITGPGSDSVQARSVEWARGHHLGGLVDSVERYWYAHHQAKVGGAPSVAVALPRIAAVPATTNATPPATTNATPPATTNATPPATTNATPAATTADGPAAGAQPSPSTIGSTVPTVIDVPARDANAAVPLGPPAPLQTPASSAIAGEGAWSPIGASVDGVAGAYGTLIRPDDVHTSILDAVVWIDPRVLSLRHYPGTLIPGTPWDRPDHVEPDRQAQLVAAFEGGFRIQDSRGGMVLGGTVLTPMRVGAATLAIDANGVPNIGAWGTDIVDSPSLDSARQNLDLIVVDGAAVPNLLQDPNRHWGFTGPANKSAVWRSGAGITADGALVWVGGPGLTIQALADTLVRAGAIRGMQLDINHEWVELNTYATNADGTVSGTRVLPGMQHSDNRWLTEDTRDFIAAFHRPATP